MAIAPNVALSRIDGEYVDFQGNAIAGQIKFTLNELQRNTFADQILVPSTASLTFDANGKFSVDLPSTAETALTPSGFTYAVEESFSGGASYTISLPVINQESTRTNLVYNPSFEDWTTLNSVAGWSATSANINRVTDAVFGQFSLECTSTVTGTFGITSTNSITGRIPVIPGRTYTVSAYAKRGSVGSRNIGIRLDFFEESSDATTLQTDITNITLTTTWQRVSVTATAPFNAYWVDIGLLTTNTGAVGDTLRFDAILLEESATLGSYFDGSVVPTGAGGEITITSAVESGANTVYTTNVIHNLTVGSSVYVRDTNSGYWNTANRTVTAITPTTFTTATYNPSYVRLSGTNGHYMSVPDASALDITGDIDIRVRVAMDDWTPPSQDRTLLAKYGASGNRSYNFFLNQNGTLGLVWSADGTTTISKASTVAPTVNDGETKWVRVTLDVDNGASGNDVIFYTSDDGTTWTQVGTTVTTAGTTSIFNSTAVLEIGSNGTGTLVALGEFYKAELYNGIAGTKVLDIDFSSARVGLSSTFTAVTGQTVTLNPSTSFDKAVISYFQGDAHNSPSVYPQYGGTYQIASLRPTSTITNPQIALAYYPQWVVLENIVTALDVILDDNDTTFNPTPLQLQHLSPAFQTYDVLATGYTNYADLADETTVKITVADVSATETLVESFETTALADLATGETIESQFIQPLMLFGN